MDESVHDRRVAELRGVQVSDPLGIIDKYREIVGEPASNQLPYGVSFSRMIETIVEHEEGYETQSVATS